MLIMGEDHGLQLGAYGTSGIETPNLDALAATGTRFENAYVTVPTCSASKAAMFTGVYNHLTGAVHNVQEFVGSAEELAAANPTWYANPNSAYNRLAIAEQYPTLIEVLSTAGYYTGTQNKFHLSPHTKFPYDEWAVGNDANNVDGFIDNAHLAEKPWLLVHHVKHPHRPFPTTLTVDPGTVPLPGFLPDSEAAQLDWAEYLSGVEHADKQVGDVLKALEGRDDLANTVVIYIGDHGPAYHRGKLSTYEFGLQVPLIVSGPGIQQGAVADELFSGVDLMPTLLDLLGVEAPEFQQGLSHRLALAGDPYAIGHDYLVGAVKTDRSISDGRYQLISMPDPNATAMPPDNREFDIWGNRVYQDIVANKDDPAYADAYRYLDAADANLPDYSRPEFEFYDLDADPWELNDLASSPTFAPHINRMKTALQLWGYHNADPDVQLYRTQAAPPQRLPHDAISIHDDFSTPSGPLSGAGGWTTRQFGRNGEDFAIQSPGVIDAPPGYQVVATHDDATVGYGDDFSASVDVQFDRPGVGAGLLFGYVDELNFYRFELLDGSVMADGGLDKDVRLVRHVGGVEQTLLVDTALPNYAGGWYRVQADFTAASQSVALGVFDDLGAPYFQQTYALPAMLPAESQLGIVTTLANGAQLDNFTVEIPAYVIPPRVDRQDDFTSRTGPLNEDPRWTTRIFGAQGADFEQLGQTVDAPGGFRALATYDKADYQAGDHFTLSADVQFDPSPGVGAGVVFGYLDNDNFFEFQVLDGRTSAGGGPGKDVRLVQRSGGVETDLLLVTDLVDYAGGWYTTAVDYLYETRELALTITDESDNVFFQATQVLAEAIADHSQFGMSSYLANMAKFDNFQITVTPSGMLPQLALLGDFNGDDQLDQADADLLMAAFGASTAETAQFNLVQPDETIDAADLDYWLTQIKPVVDASNLAAWSADYGDAGDGGLPVAGVEFLQWQRLAAAEMDLHALAASSNVPEPATYLLLVTGGLLALAARPRRTAASN